MSKIIIKKQFLRKIVTQNGSITQRLRAQSSRLVTNFKKAPIVFGTTPHTRLASRISLICCDFLSCTIFPLSLLFYASYLGIQVHLLYVLSLNIKKDTSIIISTIRQYSGNVKNFIAVQYKDYQRKSGANLYHGARLSSVVDFKWLAMKTT